MRHRSGLTKSAHEPISQSRIHPGDLSDRRGFFLPISGLPTELGGPEHLADGKGAIDCTDQTIMAWTMSQGTGNPNEPPMGK